MRSFYLAGLRTLPFPGHRGTQPNVVTIRFRVTHNACHSRYVPYVSVDPRPIPFVPRRSELREMGSKVYFRCLRVRVTCHTLADPTTLDTACCTNITGIPSIYRNLTYGALLRTVCRYIPETKECGCEQTNPNRETRLMHGQSIETRILYEYP